MRTQATTYGRGGCHSELDANPYSSPAKTGRLTVQAIEAIDTLLVLNTRKKNKMKRKAIGMGIIPMAAPAPVATPLPPLPRRKMEKSCPRTEAKATKTVTMG
jgi:hypothetical protein